MTGDDVMISAVGAGGDLAEGRIGRLYVRLGPSALRLAYMLTGDRAAAEDLMHDAFLRFVGRLQFLRDPDAHEAYLRRTVVNLAKNYFRRRSIERAHLQREAGLRQIDSVEPDVPAYESMRAALLALPVRQRAALALRYYEDRSDSEIAEILQCRPATVRSLISRGLRLLRRTSEVTS